tara:strand:+ start:826 stop:1026 length:201 start_codon:yes stop_codon:yes gene_type:complete
MTAFMLACYLNGVAQGAIYFKSVSDCTYYTKFLSNQQFDNETGQTVIYKCICKLVPQVNDKKVRVY